MGPETQVEESIEEGVEAAVDIGQAGSIWMSQKQETKETTGARSQIEVRQGIHAFQDMERRPANGKHHNQSSDNLQQPLFFLVLFAHIVEVACHSAADETVEDGHG